MLRCHRLTKSTADAEELFNKYFRGPNRVFDLNTYALNEMLTLYIGEWNYEEAVDLISRVDRPDSEFGNTMEWNLIVYNTVMKTFQEIGDLASVEKYLTRLLAEGLSPSSVTLMIYIRSLIESGQLESVFLCGFFDSSV